MDFKEYQGKAFRTVPSNETRKDLLANFSMGLAGESGEVIDQLKKHLYHGHTLDIAHVAEELGDILFYVTNMATILDLDIADIAQGNYDKLLKRYPNGFDKEKSINRTV